MATSCRLAGSERVERERVHSSCLELYNSCLPACRALFTLAALAADLGGFTFGLELVGLGAGAAFLAAAFSSNAASTIFNQSSGTHLSGLRGKRLHCEYFVWRQWGEGCGAGRYKMGRHAVGTQTHSPASWLFACACSQVCIAVSPDLCIEPSFVASTPSRTKSRPTS